jgi:hypothetical protein
MTRRKPTQRPTQATERPETTPAAPSTPDDPSEAAPTIVEGDAVPVVEDDDGETDTVRPGQAIAAPGEPMGGYEKWRMVTVAGCAIEGCPDPAAVVRLGPDWQAEVTDPDDGAAVPIVGCGNPWHYATASMGDAPAPVGIRADMAAPPTRDERKVTRREAGHVAQEQERRGIAEGGPGSTMYVVRISPKALARILSVAGIPEVYAVVEAVPE